MALALIDEALEAWAKQPGAVLADCGCGDKGAFRRGLDERGLP